MKSALLKWYGMRSSALALSLILFLSFSLSLFSFVSWMSNTQNICIVLLIWRRSFSPKQQMKNCTRCTSTWDFAQVQQRLQHSALLMMMTAAMATRRVLFRPSLSLTYTVLPKEKIGIEMPKKMEILCKPKWQKTRKGAAKKWGRKWLEQAHTINRFKTDRMHST